MDREKVASRMILSVGYDAQRQMLEVEMHSGAVYRYWHVPPEKALEMQRAHSIGRFFLEEIKNAYTCRKVAQDEAETEIG